MQMIQFSQTALLISRKMKNMIEKTEVSRSDPSQSSHSQSRLIISVLPVNEVLIIFPSIVSMKHTTEPIYQQQERKPQFFFILSSKGVEYS